MILSKNAQTRRTIEQVAESLKARGHQVERSQWGLWLLDGAEVTAAQLVSVESGDDAIEAEARILCDRLSEFELTNDHEEMARQYLGHVEPSLSRLKAILKEGKSDG